MNTNQLKLFAQKARTLIRGGVSRQLRYWGFDEKGNVDCRPEKVEGGIIHREEVMDDPGILKRWEALQAAVKRHGFDAVVEEAAYTWFNRLMAIRILAKNGYDMPLLEYADGRSNIPNMLQRARRGQYSFLDADEQKRLKPILTDYTKEAQAFAILLTGYCHSHALLNNVFGRLDDYTELLLPADMLNENGFIHFLNTTTAISDDDYRQVELIGWLYQFYISERKDEVFKQFKKNKKAEAKDIPAATQIFTPNWIVKYMVENTVGKIWLDKHPDSPLKNQMKYLVENEDSVIASGAKQPLINEVHDLKLLDPAAGSGHILVEGFDLLYAMYEEEYYMPEEAVESILKNNLFGLDIDLRAAQLARFALLMKAASKYPGILQKDILPKVYAMPEPALFSRQEGLDFLGSEGLKLEDKLSRALQLMQQGQNLGSTMQFDFSEAERALLQKRLVELKDKSIRNTFEEALLTKITPFIEVLLVLGNRYEAIAANPPYMGSSNMNGELKQYINTHYPDSKSDLMTVFMELAFELVKKNGQVGMINLPSWMFLSSFEKLRKKLIASVFFNSLIQQGRGIFGSDFGSVSFCFSKENPKGKKGVYRRLFKEHVKVDSVEEKERRFLDESYGYFISEQTNFSKIPGSPIAYWASEVILENFENFDKLGQLCELRKGLATSDNNRFLRVWHEVNINRTSLMNLKDRSKKWFPHNKGGAVKRWFGNNEFIINWEDDGNEIRNFRDAKGKLLSRPQNLEYRFKQAVTWSKITSGAFSARICFGEYLFDDAAAICYHKDIDLLYNVLGFLNSNVAQKCLNLINPTLNIQIGDISGVPITINNRKKEVSNAIEIAQRDWNSRETSWDFSSLFLLNGESTYCEESYLSWINFVSSDFYKLHEIEEELNYEFIEKYSLGNEVEPGVSLGKITILQEELDEKELEKVDKSLRKHRQWKLVDGKWELFVDENVPLPELPIKRDVVMKQLISYAVGCMMGRFRLDQPGLQIAHPNPTAEEVCTYTHNGHEFEIDDDAIIPLMGSNCNFSDDALNRFNHFLEVVWGADTLTENKNFLEECLDQEIEKYLVRDFWKDHCRTYKKKPIYWLFSSEKGAFQVLVYMHRMNRFTVTKIRDKYLLKHLQNLQQEIALLDGQSGLSREEQKRLDSLRVQYHECERYELLLKDCADRQIEFDLDDGVTENYKLFEGVVAKIK